MQLRRFHELRSVMGCNTRHPPLPALAAVGETKLAVFVVQVRQVDY
jgi:hypothetical protein